jgi:pilus assembly protein Flp/PilA
MFCRTCFIVIPSIGLSFGSIPQERDGRGLSTTARNDLHLLEYLDSGTGNLEILGGKVYNCTTLNKHMRGFPLMKNERRRGAMLFTLEEKAQGLVEYALILVLVSVVVIGALSILGPVIGNIFTKINSALITI